MVSDCMLLQKNEKRSCPKCSLRICFSLLCKLSHQINTALFAFYISMQTVSLYHCFLLHIVALSKLCANSQTKPPCFCKSKLWIMSLSSFFVKCRTRAPLYWKWNFWFWLSYLISFFCLFFSFFCNIRLHLQFFKSGTENCCSSDLFNLCLSYQFFHLLQTKPANFPFHGVFFFWCTKYIRGGFLTYITLF